MNHAPPVLDTLNPAVLGDYPVGYVVIASCELYLFANDIVDLLDVFGVNDIRKAPAREPHEVRSRVALKDSGNVITDEYYVFCLVGLVHKKSAGNVGRYFCEVYAVVLVEHIFLTPPICV